MQIVSSNRHIKCMLTALILLKFEYCKELDTDKEPENQQSLNPNVFQTSMQVPLARIP